jgi:hypothetical protein
MSPIFSTLGANSIIRMWAIGMRVLKRLPSALRTLPTLIVLATRNLWSKQQITGEEDVAITLTSHGHRLKYVHLALESIGRGSRRAREVVLWIEEPNVVAKPPPSLARLMKRGLTLAYSEPGYGPHTKYYPYVLSGPDPARPFVTADDDVLYSRNWLASLMNSYKSDSSSIHCIRAHVARARNDGSLAPYNEWEPCTTTLPRLRNFATGVSGVLYPPEMLRVLTGAGTRFLHTCPKADDIWLHVNAAKAGIKTRQVFNRPILYPIIPGSQKGALSIANTIHEMNDIQIGETYDTATIAQLRD